MQTIIQPETTPHMTRTRLGAPPKFRPRERFLRVWFFFSGVVIHVYIWDIVLARFVLTRWYVRRSAMQRWVGIARQFRQLAIELGGVHIKLGQFLSSRADIIPEAVRRELAGLQDEVPPAPANLALERIIEELGAPPGEVFLRFDHEAVAAASLGQVHFATLHDGRDVAVKIQRPYIEEIVEIDLSAIALVVRVIKNYAPIRRRARLDALLDEFARVLRQELDYVQEARNAELFRINFAGMPEIYVPQPIVELTTRRVLVMERINGIKINDRQALQAAGIDQRELAERLNRIYLKQFFVDGFFHADPHPGNLFVRVEPDLPLTSYTNGRTPPADPSTATNGSNPPRKTPFTLIFIDFGMVGHLPPEVMNTVRSGVIGLATNDAERIVDALDRLKMILPGADKRPIIRAIQVMLRYSYNRTVRELNNMDVEAIFDETQDMIYDLPFQIPQDLLYLGRAISMVGGLATELYPDINLFESLQPFAQQMLQQEHNNGNWLGQIQTELREWGQIMITLPRQMDAYYKAANQGELQLRSDFGRLERGIRRVEQSTDRLAGGIIAVGLFLGGVQLRVRGFEKEAQRAWWGAIAALLWVLRPRSQSSR